MKIRELFIQAPKEKHQEIIIDGNRLYYDGEEYIVEGMDFLEGELKLIHSHKGLEQKLAQIVAKLSAK